MSIEEPPRVRPTAIPGLLLVDLPVHADSRGSFKENWQRAKLTARGLPDFAPVQHNIAVNDAVGTTRGIHAEPWDKYVSVATGRIFGAWVDLRAGAGFGTVVTAEIDPSRAVFVPRGVGNAYQTLEPGTVYSYLVTAHWSPDATYSLVNLADPALGIDWPIPLDRAAISAKDRAHPLLADTAPVPPLRAVVLGAGGQLGTALRRAMPTAHFVTRAELDITDPAALASWGWQDYDVVVNAAAHTAVDAAETESGRVTAWRVNAAAPAALARIATEHRLLLVHVSTDYVFDGTRTEHPEDEPVSPLSVYGQSKAAGEAAVRTTARHYLVRTSWLIGGGPNFVRTMAALAARGVDPAVVDDQVGRLTFADDLADGIGHLIGAGAPYGTYHLTNTGPVQSWCAIARDVFRLLGHDPARVRAIDTAEYAAGRPGIAPRPRHSTLALDKIIATGFEPRPAAAALAGYLADHPTDHRAGHLAGDPGTPA